MTESHEYGPDLHDLNAGIHDEAVAEEAALPVSKPSTFKRGDPERDRDFFQKIRQDLPPDNLELSRHADLEAENGRTYDYD
jgi:hypothetical protein